MIAEKEGERDAKTKRPTAWRCTPECKQPTSEEAQCIVTIKKLFDKPVQTLREGLQIIDKCTLHGHYTCPVRADNDKKPYYELAGHPLPCSQANSHCESSLRVLRAAATHFPVLRRFLILLYEAIRQHRLLHRIDTALCAGDFEALITICGIEDCKALFTTCSPDQTASFQDSANQPIRLQQSNLPDLETDLHLQHVGLIADVEKKFALDAEFPCCSCERLLLRKQVTAFKFSDAKFSSQAWKTLKTHLINQDANADSLTHYICQYCRPVLNKDGMPSRCILNGLITEPMPKELERLDPLSKQLIQRGKAFQAVVRLGTYTGKVPSYNSLKACKGTMFFLPLPLDKTIQTIDDVINGRGMSSVGLPDPELYIVVSGNPSKQKVLWQSMVNVAHVTAAIKKLKQINWLYANIDDSSVVDACKRIIESISVTTSTMLVKATTEDIKSFQAYTIRWLDQKQSNLSDTEHYKLMNVKEDALSNKLQHLDVLCFPTLFPSGRFGESHDRSTPISLSEYAKSRLLNKDSRFRKDCQYVFYLLWQKEMREIAAGVYNLMKGTRQHALPVGEFMDRVSNSDEDIEANLSTVFQSVRGSKQYWYLRRSEVLCMVREYGSPTLFLTLSCAEYESLEISRYLRKVNDVPDSYPIGKLCTEDPISVSRKFSQKFHDFFQTVILKGGVLGQVTHYFYKKEYQARGAPHYHMILWIDGAPTVGKDEPEEVLHWIQEKITCRIPEEDSNPELHQLVSKYQRHKCSGYCQRRRRAKGTFITYCRFGYPRQACESATLRSMDECLKSSHRQMYRLPRSPQEIRINNYNPLLLMLWKANMDIQFIGESSLAVAQYVTGYVTKAEKSNMQEVWQEVSTHQTVYSKLWLFGVRSLKSRECGLYEASDLLLGDHLCEKSVTIKWVDVSQPHNRKRRLRDHSKLVEMRERDPNCMNIFEANLVDTFYPERPDDMEDVCLYDFVADYAKCGVDKDGKTKYRRLNKNILPNHKLYDPNKENERESYYYSLLLLFVPFRNEMDLVKERERAEDAFQRHMEHTNALNVHSDKLQKMLTARENVQRINEARQAQVEDVPIPEPSEEDEGPQVAGEATSAMHDVANFQEAHKNTISFDELVSSLNVDQKRVFQLVKYHLEHQLQHENGACKCSDMKPFHMFVSGVGGTGKYFLIKTIRALVTQVWHNEKESLLCAVTAPTGLAAFNVGGVTIHRLLQLPIEHEGRAAGYWRLGKDSLKIMRSSLSKLRVLIIDEVSMVSNLNLAYIHLRLDEIFARDQWFGGVNVLFVGDILQLPPVNGALVFDKISSKSVALKLGCMTSVNIWQETVVYDELTINERQKEDLVFSSMLDEVRRGCPSQETIHALEDKVITTPVVDKFEELLADKQSPLSLFPTRKACLQFNSNMLSRLQTETHEIPSIDEVNETMSTFKWSKKATEELKKLNTDCNMTAGLEAVLQVAVGARVMLRRNIDTRKGLVNGALGTVISIKAHHISVHFDNMSDVYDVEKVKSKFMVMKKIYVFRKQFPLILAFAITIHKCQGLSLDCAMMDLSDQVFSPGMAYVALSRVKRLENLHLIAFKPQCIIVSTPCLQEINRLRQTYCPNLPQYTVREFAHQKRKRKLSGHAVPTPLPPKQPRISRKRKKSDINTTVKQVLPPAKKTRTSSPEVVCLSPTRPLVPAWYHTRCYNPLTVEDQHQVCHDVGLQFVCANGCTAGGPNVPLRHPTSVHHIRGDGNCLFRAFSYAITGSERQHFRLRTAIINHMRCTEACMSLLGGYISDLTLEEYIEHSQMAQNYVWGSQNECLY